MACVIKYEDERRFLPGLAQTCYEKRELDKIIDHKIQRQINPIALSKFSAIAYQCLKKGREERPTIVEVALELKRVREIQMSSPSVMIRRPETFSHSTYSELSDAKHKTEDLETLFNNDAYRSRIASDEDERQRYIEKIVVLFHAVHSIEGSNISMRASKRSMVDKLQAILDVLDPQPSKTT